MARDNTARKDRRLYAKFDIGMDEHAKIIILSDAAFRALFESTLYSRRQLTDGFLDERIVLRKWGAAIAEELSANDPQRPSWIKVDGGWLIHDFAQHQTTNDDIEKKREAGRKGGLAKANQKASESVAPASEVLKPVLSNSLAKTETETEASKRTSSSPAAPPMEFDAFWAIYPKKVAKQAAIKAWVKAVKTSDPERILEGAKAYARFVASEKTDKKYIKSPDGWLNAGRWDDEIDPPATSSSSPWDRKGPHT